MTTLQNSWLGGVTFLAKEKIINLSKKTASTQFEIGKVIAEVKAEMQKKKSDNPKQSETINKEYESFLEDLPFGKGVANKFVTISNDSMIEKFIDIAPVSYNTLYEDLCGESELVWKFLKKNGLHSYSTAKEVKALKKQYVDSTSTPKPKPTKTTTSEAISNAKDSADKVDGKSKTITEENKKVLDEIGKKIKEGSKDKSKTSSDKSNTTKSIELLKSVENPTSYNLKLSLFGIEKLNDHDMEMIELAVTSAIQDIVETDQYSDIGLFKFEETDDYKMSKQIAA